MPELPEGATPVPMEEVFAALGELWFQTRQYQRLIAQLQQQHQAAETNGKVVEAVSDPR